MTLKGLGVFPREALFTHYLSGVHILLVATMCCSATQYPASCDPLDTPPGTPLDNKYLMIRQPSGGFYKPKITDTYYQYVYYKFSQGCNMIVDSASITMRGDCTYTTSVSFDLASGTTTGRKLSTVTRSSCDDICNQTLTVAQGKLNLANRGTERMMIVMTIVRLSVKASSKLENCSVASRSAPKLGLHLDFRLRLRDINECNTASDVCNTTGTKCENTLGSLQCVADTSSKANPLLTSQQTAPTPPPTPVTGVTSIADTNNIKTLPSSTQYPNVSTTQSRHRTSGPTSPVRTAFANTPPSSPEPAEVSIAHPLSAQIASISHSSMNNPGVTATPPTHSTSDDEVETDGNPTTRIVGIVSISLPAVIVPSVIALILAGVISVHICKRQSLQGCRRACFKVRRTQGKKQSVAFNNAVYSESTSFTLPANDLLPPDEVNGSTAISRQQQTQSHQQTGSRYDHLNRNMPKSSQKSTESSSKPEHLASESTHQRTSHEEAISAGAPQAEYAQLNRGLGCDKEGNSILQEYSEPSIPMSSPQAATDDVTEDQEQEEKTVNELHGSTTSATAEKTVERAAKIPVYEVIEVEDTSTEANGPDSRNQLPPFSLGKAYIATDCCKLHTYEEVKALSYLVQNEPTSLHQHDQSATTAAHSATESAADPTNHIYSSPNALPSQLATGQLSNPTWSHQCNEYLVPCDEIQ